MGFNGFYRVFFLVLLAFTGFKWVSMGFIKFFFLVKLGFTGLKWVSMGCDGFQWVL